MPRFLTAERGLSIVSSTGYLAALVIGSFAGYLVGAWLSDRLGRRLLFLIFLLGAIAVVISHTQIPLSNGASWVLGFFVSGYFSGMGVFLTELYLTCLRGSGQGLCYDFGRGIGALFPAAVGYLSAEAVLARAIAIFAYVAYSVFFLAAFALPEIRGRVAGPPYANTIPFARALNDAATERCLWGSDWPHVAAGDAPPRIAALLDLIAD